MLSGDIPLNHSTTVLLDGHQGLDDYQSFLAIWEKVEVETGIEELRRRLEFIMRNGGLLEDFLHAGRKINSIAIGEDIKSIRAIAENDKAIIIFESDSNLFSGLQSILIACRRIPSIWLSLQIIASGMM